MQDRKTPGNSVGGWIVQEDGKPFPFEAHYTYFLAKRTIDTLRDLVDTGVAANIRCTCSWIFSIHTSRSPSQLDLSSESRNCAR